MLDQVTGFGQIIIADEDKTRLLFGLGLAIVSIAFAATMMMKPHARYAARSIREQRLLRC